MEWMIFGSVVLVAVVVVGWGTRSRLNRGSSSADPERARVAREIAQQIDRGRDAGGGIR